MNAWSREVVISRVLRHVSSAVDHFKVKSTSCQRFKEHNEVTSLSLYRFVSNFSLYFSRALRLWLVEGVSLSWIFFSCTVTCEVFVHFVTCQVFVSLLNVNFAVYDFCLQQILNWSVFHDHARKGFSHDEILDLEVVVACVSNWLCPSVELMRFATLCLYTHCCVY